MGPSLDTNRKSSTKHSSQNTKKGYTLLESSPYQTKYISYQSQLSRESTCIKYKWGAIVTAAGETFDQELNINEPLLQWLSSRLLERPAVPASG